MTDFRDLSLDDMDDQGKYLYKLITKSQVVSYKLVFIVPYPPPPLFFSSRHGPDWGMGLFLKMCN